jgi:hypothetical protein
MVCKIIKYLHIRPTCHVYDELRFAVYHVCVISVISLNYTFSTIFQTSTFV